MIDLLEEASFVLEATWLSLPYLFVKPCVIILLSHYFFYPTEYIFSLSFIHIVLGHKYEGWKGFGVWSSPLCVVESGSGRY
jgi:hypothetical protein